jgi:glycosyltransferase involved in cell wall biosynthesis
MSGVAAMNARRRHDLPVVQTYHALGTVKRRHLGARDTSPRRRVSYERALGQAVDRVIAQCQDEVHELIQMGVPRARVAVVPSGVDGRVFGTAGPAVAREEDRPRVLTVSRLVERKGLQDLIAAMRLVPDAECVVIGGPPADQLAGDPYARHLLQAAESAGVADRVRLVGSVRHEHIASWYRSADVVVAAPWYEPFGLTPLEAMACGVPVIGTAVGGLVDTIVDGITGDLVPPRDPHALGTALSKLLNDPMRRMTYAAAAIDRVQRCYSWDRVAAQLGALYTTVSGPRQRVEAVA